MRPAFVRRLGSLRPLTTITALLFGGTALALAIATIWYLPGKNPRAVLGLLSAASAGMTLYTLARGNRFTPGEATLFLAVFLGGATAMTVTTDRDLGALSNGLVLPLLGIYAGWLLPRRAAPVFYAGVLGWLIAMLTRGDPMLAAMAGVGATQSVVATEIAWRLTVRISGLMYVDALTGVLNRAGMIRRADRMIERSRIEHSPLCLAVIDLDDLRTINNSAGHQAGDAHLRRAVTTWAALGADGVVTGRIGGDEFVLLFPRTREHEAQERLAQVQRESSVRWSFGVTEVRAHDTYDLAAERADARMYAAKPRSLTPREDRAP